ncbi:MAG TPA: class I SAM-dependent methyltransferase [Polyangiaceae bacterium]|jgi:SAM-dependent methyltransferase|nr:class I SAM-dependent methyltransferase [Polyangiaceae bacterium]
MSELDSGRGGPVPGSPISRDDWDSHWSRYAGSNELNPANDYRRQLIYEALDLQSGEQPVSLLELGCGHGQFAWDLLRSYPRVRFVGLDRSAEAVRLASERVPAGVFLQADLAQPDSLPAQYRGFANRAVCSEVLEHVDDPAALLRGARSLFAPGCRLVITVPGGPMSAFDRHIGHRRHFTRDALARVIRDAGLEPVRVEGAGFPFFNAYRLAVVARGDRLIADAAPGSDRPLPLSARAAMLAFSRLFRLNRARGRWGWQLLAVAQEPGALSGTR